MAVADMCSTTRSMSKEVVIDWNIEEFEKAIAVADSSLLTSAQYPFRVERQFVKFDNELVVPQGDVSLSCTLKATLDNFSLRNQIKLRIEVEFQLNKVDIRVRMKLVGHLLDGAGRVKATKEGKITTLVMQQWAKSTSVEFTSDNVKQLLADGDLKVRCELTMYSEITNTPARMRPHFTNELQSVGAHMNELRMEACLTDFQLVVKEEQFDVHKVVLAAQSAYFRKMLQADMKERREGRVSIDDITPEAVEEMLTYMYTGTSSRLVEMKSELLKVADKYEIDDLKSLCEEALYNELALKNVIETFLLADMHNAKSLRATCVRLIKDNISCLKETDEWERLKNSPQFHDLYIQIMESELMPPSKKVKLMPPSEKVKLMPPSKKVKLMTPSKK